MTDEKPQPPKIDGAPGLIWRTQKYGWEARWLARTDLRAKGYKPPVVRLWGGEWPDDAARAYIADQCQDCQRHMLNFSRGTDVTPLLPYDGSLSKLIDSYKNDPDSTFHRKLRYRTRMNYDGLLRRLSRERGPEKIENIRTRDILRWHEGWSEGGKIAMGHTMVAMLRTVVGFGATILEDEDCMKLSGMLSKMKFEMGKPRSERLTADNVIAIREMAHRMNMHSLALAQAFQFELMLRQKDVIGEWVPTAEKVNEPEQTDVAERVTHKGKKWLRGLRWSEIDADLTIRHVTSKKQKKIEVSLRHAPMVMEELARFGDKLPAAGPVIIHEATGRPYDPHFFRDMWRVVADAAGIPRGVRNMDSRAGAISEATEAGAELEHVRHAATHSDIGMTQRYSRGSEEKIAAVQARRAEHRAKKNVQ